MDLKIESKITHIISPDIANSQVLNNLINGSDESTAFKVEHVDRKDFLLNASQSINLFDHILTDKAKAVLIHAQCYRTVKTPLQKPDPIQFQVSIDGTPLAKMAQFQLIDLKDFDSDILFDEFDVVPIVTISGIGTGATATATIVDGEIDEITVTDGGSGYNDSTTAVIENGGGSGATLSVTQVGGVITAIDVIKGGSDYSDSGVLSIIVGSIL